MSRSNAVLYNASGQPVGHLLYSNTVDLLYSAVFPSSKEAWEGNAANIVSRACSCGSSGPLLVQVEDNYPWLVQACIPCGAITKGAFRPGDCFGLCGSVCD